MSEKMPIVGKRQKGQRIQSILFDRDFWTVGLAREWLKSHRLHFDAVDSTTNYLRFRQYDPKKKEKYFTKKLRDHIELILPI